jgi:hypothetical protein
MKIQHYAALTHTVRLGESNNFGSPTPSERQHHLVIASHERQHARPENHYSHRECSQVAHGRGHHVLCMFAIALSKEWMTMSKSR